MAGEAAERIFAGEFNQSAHLIEQGDPPRLGILTLSGGWCYRIFVVGALVEVEGSKGQVHRARLADPTGAFDIRFYQQGVPPARTIEEITPPAFIALSGLAKISGGREQKRVFIEPEMVTPVDRKSRDCWVLSTAERTISRLETLAGVIKGNSSEDCALEAVTRYQLTIEDLYRLRDMVEGALKTVSSISYPPPPSMMDAREVVLAIISSHPPPVSISVVVGDAVCQGLREDDVRQCLLQLLEEGECYSPRNGYIKRL